MKNLQDRSVDMGEFVAMPDDDLIICRCEEITKGEIRRAVHDGMTSLIEIKRYLRSGMGLCQGQTCAKLVRAVVAAECKASPAQFELAQPRSPARPIEMRTFANEE